MYIAVGRRIDLLVGSHLRSTTSAAGGGRQPVATRKIHMRKETVEFTQAELRVLGTEFEDVQQRIACGAIISLCRVNQGGGMDRSRSLERSASKKGGRISRVTFAPGGEKRGVANGKAGRGRRRWGDEIDQS